MVSIENLIDAIHAACTHQEPVCIIVVLHSWMIRHMQSATFIFKIIHVHVTFYP